MVNKGVREYVKDVREHFTNKRCKGQVIGNNILV